MRDRAGFFAGCADALTEMCAYYVVAGILIMSRRGWGLHLFWILLCTAVCSVIFTMLLRKPRSVPVLTVVTGVLFAAVLAVFILASETPMKFGYVFVLSVGAGMAAGIPLNYAINRPLMHKHLMRLDALILALAGLMLCREVLGIDMGTVALVVAVLFMDAAAAVGLRMTEGGTGDTQNAFKAVLVALGGAVGLAALIGALVALFSRSGTVTGTVLRSIGAFFRVIGRALESVFRWFAGLVKVKDDYGQLHLEEMGSIPELEQMAARPELNFDPAILGILLCVLLAAAVVFLLIYLRKKTVIRGTKSVAVPSDTVVRRKGGAFGTWWERLKAAIRFRWTAFVHRNTPGGVLVYAERKARNRRTPRRKGESMRQFLRRMDKSGGLEPLANALEQEYYGGLGRTMSARACREMRTYIRKVMQHG